MSECEFNDTWAKRAVMLWAKTGRPILECLARTAPAEIDAANARAYQQVHDAIEHHQKRLVANIEAAQSSVVPIDVWEDEVPLANSRRS